MGSILPLLLFTIDDLSGDLWRVNGDWLRCRRMVGGELLFARDDLLIS